MLHLAVIALFTTITTQATEPDAEKASQSKTAGETTTKKVEVTTTMKETDFGGETTIHLTMGDKTQAVATATGMCRVEAGTEQVLYTVSCFEAGASTDFEVRQVKGQVEVWRQMADEGDESSVSSWSKVWPAKP